jgi:nitroreductase
MELASAIKTRRSIRKFTDYYITDEEIKEILEAARYAPSWANTQVWEYIVIRDKEQIHKVTETYSSTNPGRNCSFSSSALIAVCAKVKVSGCKNGEEVTKFSNWYMFDLGLSVQNLCLRAFDLGIGTVVVGSMNHEACSRLLKLPENIELAVVIPLGRPESIPEKAPRRKELKDFVHLDYFGNVF